MKKSLYIILGVVVVALLYGLSTYNSLVRGNENINNQWAQVETQYQRRFDLIPNMVKAASGVMKQEQAVFGAIADARTRYAGAKNVNDKVKAANEVESSLARLLVVTENYPQLKSSDNVTNLTVELEGAENRVSIERKKFNDATRDYNLTVKRFPGSMLASLFGFNERTYFESVAGAEKAPDVNL
mgnify:CR=1 FL=1